ncbi:MAG TPA: flagellar basal body P-ring formation chaperone FlgA [Rhizomicrobium sp.]|nr:flagellar basal body P-ring formation chaperone FlgA [Rhizomicrobium sp.]
MKALVLMALFALAVSPALADAPGQARIVVPSHDIPRGATIGDSDLAYVNATSDQLAFGVVTSMNALDGMETRRVLRAGEPVRGDDVRKPILVTKGQTVTMIFAAPGLTLTATGKAMSEGGIGETVTVLNPVSFRQITAVVTGAGEVRAGDVTSVIAPQQVASSKP